MRVGDTLMQFCNFLLRLLCELELILKIFDIIELILKVFDIIYTYIYTKCISFLALQYLEIILKIIETTYYFVS